MPSTPLTPDETAALLRRNVLMQAGVPVADAYKLAEDFPAVTLAQLLILVLDFTHDPTTLDATTWFSARLETLNTKEATE